MKIECCKCQHEYAFEPFQVKEAIVIECPDCGFAHVVDFTAVLFDKVKEEDKQEVRTVKLLNYYPTYSGSRIANTSRVDQSGSDEGDVIDWSKDDAFIVAVMMQDTSGKDTTAENYKLQWQDDTDVSGYTDLTSSGELIYTTSTVLTNGNAVGSSNNICTEPYAYNESAGLECEDGATTYGVLLGKTVGDQCSETQFGVDPAGADTDHTYSFRLYSTVQSAVVGTCGATITTLDADTDQPSVVLDTADEYDFGEDTTPTLEFTGTDPSDADVTYQIEIDTVDTFNSVAIGTTIDSCLDYGAVFLTLCGSPVRSQAGGETFLGKGVALDSCEFYINKYGLPTGNVVAKLYAHTGVFGTSGIATGTPLATSNTLDISTLTTSPQMKTFTFGSPYTPLLDVPYVIAIEYTGGDTSNYLSVGLADSGGGAHEGNYCFFKDSEWNSSIIQSVIFSLSCTAGSYVPLIHKQSSVAIHLGFVNTTDGGDTDPFDSGDKCSFTVQAGDALGDGTYYWRVRGIDPTPGSNTYGDWSEIRSFTISLIPVYDEDITEEIGADISADDKQDNIEDLTSTIGADISVVDKQDSIEDLVLDIGAGVTVTDLKQFSEALTTIIGSGVSGEDLKQFTETLTSIVGADVSGEDKQHGIEALTSIIGADISGDDKQHGIEALNTIIGADVSGEDKQHGIEALTSIIGADISAEDKKHGTEALTSIIGADISGEDLKQFTETLTSIIGADISGEDKQHGVEALTSIVGADVSGEDKQQSIEALTTIIGADISGEDLKQFTEALTSIIGADILGDDKQHGIEALNTIIGADVSGEDKQHGIEALTSIIGADISAEDKKHGIEALTSIIGADVSGEDKQQSIEALTTIIGADISTEDKQQSIEALNTIIGVDISGEDKMHGIEALTSIVGADISSKDKQQFTETLTSIVGADVSGEDKQHGVEALNTIVGSNISSEDKQLFTEALTTIVTSDISVKDKQQRIEDLIVSIGASVTIVETLVEAPTYVEHLTTDIGVQTLLNDYPNIGIMQVSAFAITPRITASAITPTVLAVSKTPKILAEVI